jgi:hypothetical protein
MQHRRSLALLLGQNPIQCLLWPPFLSRAYSTFYYKYKGTKPFRLEIISDALSHSRIRGWNAVFHQIGYTNFRNGFFAILSYVFKSDVYLLQKQAYSCEIWNSQVVLRWWSSGMMPCSLVNTYTPTKLHGVTLQKHTYVSTKLQMSCIFYNIRISL